MTFSVEANCGPVNQTGCTVPASPAPDDSPAAAANSTSEEEADSVGGQPISTVASPTPSPTVTPPVTEEIGGLIVDLDLVDEIAQTAAAGTFTCSQITSCVAGNVCILLSDASGSQCRVPPQDVGDGAYCCASAAAEECTGTVFDERRGTPGVCAPGLLCDQQSRSCSVGG